MLRYIAKKCTDILIKREIVLCDKEKIYIYGFELLWSFVLCIICMISCSIVFGYWGELMVFLLFFVPIRIVAGGYHAKSYGNCFLFTNFIATGSVFVSQQLWNWNTENLEVILWCILIVSIIYIWISAPVVTGLHPLKSELIIRNRSYSQVVLRIELMVLIFMKILLNNCFVYTAIVTTCVVAIMIRISKEGAKRIWICF